MKPSENYAEAVAECERIARTYGKDSKAHRMALELVAFEYTAMSRPRPEKGGDFCWREFLKNCAILAGVLLLLAWVLKNPGDAKVVGGILLWFIGMGIGIVVFVRALPAILIVAVPLGVIVGAVWLLKTVWGLF